MLLFQVWFEHGWPMGVHYWRKYSFVTGSVALWGQGFESSYVCSSVDNGSLPPDRFSIKI